MRNILKICGWLVLGVGAKRLIAPTALGAHPGVMHNGLHIGAGAVLVWAAMYGSLKAARVWGLVIGVSYVALALGGFALGAPGIVEGRLTDPRLWSLGALVLGTVDHVTHLATGVALMMAGFSGSRVPPPSGPRAVQREEREPTTAGAGYRR